MLQVGRGWGGWGAEFVRPQLNGELHNEKKYKYSCLLGTRTQNLNAFRANTQSGWVFALNAFKALTSLRATLASK